MLARRILWSLLVAAVIVTAPVAEAQQNFDVVVAGFDASFGCFILPIVQPVQQWYGPDRTDYDSDIMTIASADGRRVLALLDGAPLQIVELRPDGSQSPFYSGSPGFGSSMTIAPNGTVFVSVGGVTPSLVRISAAGVLEATYPLTTDMIDVASDGCTIYYRTGANVIARINGCTGAPLPDFTSLTWVNAFEVLPGGEVLVSTEDEVHLYDASGAFVRVVASLPAYGLNDHMAEATALSGGVLYVAATNSCDATDSFLLRVAFSDGAELSRAPLEMTGAAAIVVGNAVAGVPTLGEMALALLAFTLAAGGALVLKIR